MAIPASVSAQLTALSARIPAFAAGVPPIVAREQVPTASSIARVVMMHDLNGKMQAVFPADRLLDVDVLNGKVRRELVAMPLAEVAALAARYRVDSFPVLPELTELPMIVDEALFAVDAVYIETGEADRLFRLSREQFAALTANTNVQAFSVAISDIAVNVDDTGRDIEQINTAIQRFTQLRIRQRLEDTLELPPLPETAQRIIHLRVDPNAGVEELADLVESDPSLAAQVVSWASSSFYAAPGKIRSVHDAIMRVLGYDLVMNLSMGLAMGKTLKQPKDHAAGYLGYWQQAIWMAQGAAAVVTLMPRDRRPAFGLAYLSGLLHNFGYMVLAHVFPPHFSLICRHAEANRHLDNGYIEHHLLGITREQVGSRLMEIWQMPSEVVTALRHQKNIAFRGEGCEFALVLALARQLLVARGIPLGAAEPISEEVIAYLGINPAKLTETFDELAARAEDVAAVASNFS